MKKERRKQITLVCNIAFACYIAVLIYFVLLSERYGRLSPHDTYQVNLKLFREIKRFIHYHRQIGFEGVVTNLIGNIFAFSPIGFFVPIIYKKWEKFEWIHCIVVTFLLSLIIETTQLILKIGVFDVDDLLLNTLGGLIGYIFFILVRKIVRQFWKKQENQERSH